MRHRKRIKDYILQAITYIGAILSTVFLVITFVFIISNGASRINIGLLTGDYHPIVYTATLANVESCNDCSYTGNDYYSDTYGIALRDDKDNAGNGVIWVSYVDDNSPFKDLISSTGDVISMEEDQIISRISYNDSASSLTRSGASSMINDLESGYSIREMTFATSGGGIRGSLITTFYLIGLSLLFAMPLGILSAVYLNEIAPKNRVTNLLRTFIETLTGVPSIIYGLLGITVFVPLTVYLNLSKGQNLIAGGLTLAVILLPVVIRTTEESLKSIPNDYRKASLALGANYSQTVRKVVLPNALPGILTATFLAIGRVIGESAALIFVLGTAVKDRVVITESSSTLAVHIWSLMTDEPANIELASSIALIILLMVFVLNVGVKLLSMKLNKKV
ncbi:MAG: phosphate ABC transporter permease PstA [Bacillota bacterium]